MSNVRRLSSVAAVVAAMGVGFAASSAQASSLGTVDLKYHAPNFGGTAYINSQTNHNLDVYVGVYNFDMTNPSNALAGSLPGYGFCIDLAQDAPQYSAALYDINTLANAPTLGGDTGRIGYIDQLWDRYYDHSGWISTDNKTAANAFSLAMWELVAENYQSNATDYSVTDSNSTFHATNNTAAETEANTWLHSLTASYQPVNHWTIYALTNSSKQDFVMGLQQPPHDQIVPTPASLAASMVLLIGLGVLGLIRRRRLAL